MYPSTRTILFLLLGVTSTPLQGLAFSVPEKRTNVVAISSRGGKPRSLSQLSAKSTKSSTTTTRRSSSSWLSVLYALSDPNKNGGENSIGYYDLDADIEEFEEKSKRVIDWESLLELIVPLSAPFVAFNTYEFVASFFEFIVEFLSNKNWVAVDGGAYQAKIIAPVTNGVVIPAIAVLFATLTSTTIGTLRARQLDIRKAINTEAGELRVLESLINTFPEGFVQQMCRRYIIQYTSRIIAESQPTFSPYDEIAINPQQGMDSELNGFMHQLNIAGNDVPDRLVSEAYGVVSRLREQRYTRITALQSTYPMMHYAILAVLAIAECTGFLMEANQELLVFLNAVQLKLLWSMLIWTFVACFAVFYDLRSPFSGGYQISACVDQLYTVRKALIAEEALLLQKIERDEKDQDDKINGNNKDAVISNYTNTNNANNYKINGNVKSNVRNNGNSFSKASLLNGKRKAQSRE